MDARKRNALIEQAWHLHGVVEDSYRQHPATREDAGKWTEKQRLLLADMAIHLLQTALAPGGIELDKLKNNLHAILTISDQFLPQAELKKARDRLYADALDGQA